MQSAAMRPVEGPASTRTLAAGGGLEVPAGEPEATQALAPVPGTDPRPAERFPGEREPDTLTHREPGAIGGQFSGADLPPSSPESLAPETAFERAREGGGEFARKETKR